VGETIGLELDIANRSEVQGIGEGSAPYILSQVRLKIGDIEISVRIGWALIEEIPFHCRVASNVWLSLNIEYNCLLDFLRGHKLE